MWQNTKTAESQDLGLSVFAQGKQASSLFENFEA